MKACKHEGAATEFESDAGSITGSALNEVSMARRSFLGRAATWSAAFAAFGLGPEALMQAVSGRSIMSSAVAAGATRDRLVHPFPSDDPFNMPLGADAVLMPKDDPTTLMFDCLVHTGTGWGRAIHKPTSSAPIHRVRLGHTDGHPDRAGVRSYVSSENGGSEVNYRIPDGANPQVPGDHNWGDRRFIMVYENDIWETWKTCRADTGGTAGCSPSRDRDHPREFVTRKIVRNRSDRYSYGKNSNPGWQWPNSNEASGGSAWGGSSVAGVIRKEEIETSNPHIPHCLVFNLMRWYQVTGYQQGDPTSPFYNFAFIFPATANDKGNGLYGKYDTYVHPAWVNTTANWVAGVAVKKGDIRAHNNLHWVCFQDHTTSSGLAPGNAATHWGGGGARLGMRVALDPTVFTDAYINSQTSHLSASAAGKVRAIVRAARDYGVIICDETRDRCMQFQMDATTSSTTLGEVRFGHTWWASHLQRVVGRMSPGGPLVHVPHHSEWRAWADAGQGWGGGAPRVPYSPPLAPLSGDVPLPLSPPEAPPGIQVTGARTFDGTG